MKTHLLLLMTLTLSLLNPTSTQQNPDTPVSYNQHCSHLIPQPRLTQQQQQQYSPTHTPTLTLLTSYTTPSATSLLPTTTTTTTTTATTTTSSFITTSLLPTTTPSIFSLRSTLSIRSPRPYRGRGRFLLGLRGGPRIPLRPSVISFSLSGFWDSLSGQMCLVGYGFRGANNLHVVFKALYPNATDVYSSLIVAHLETPGFHPVSIMGFSRMHYRYSLINHSHSVSDSNINGDNSLTNAGRMFRNCQQISSLASYFELGYGRDCVSGGRNCSLIDGVVGFLPRYMSMNEIDCSGGRMVRVAFALSNVTDVRNGLRQPLDPKKTLVAEGEWNQGKTRIDFVVCRILNFTESPLNASVGDCSIRVYFQLAEKLTLRNWSVVSGRMWSDKAVDEPGYFDRVEIRGSETRRAALPDMNYEYTESERARKFCAEKTKGIKAKGKKFPDPFSQDLKFDMDVKSSKGKRAWGTAHPVFVGDRFVQSMYPYFRSSVLPSSNLPAPLNSTRYNNASVSVAYRITLSPRDEFKVGGRSFASDERIIISSEGVYDAKIGRLCMVGCWNREIEGSGSLNTSRLDCDIFIDIQFPGRSDSNSVVKGTIESKRDKTSDTLYFDTLDLSGTSLTKSQVSQVFWRMDFEITMILISNTLACIFIGLQLFHVKKHPEVLPFVSIVMLIVITLGHMIPLLLNMEAFFLSTHTKKTVLFGTGGGWLEVNEVLVRVITMVAFLLEFRLLQLTWSARGDDDTQRTALQVSEKKVILYCLPLYAGGAFIAWLVQRLRTQPTRSFRHYKMTSNASLTFWGDVKSFAGFILDAFLVPQIMFNVFSDSKDGVTALSVPYYVGTTIVRLLPHAYDLFRAHSSAWSLDPWYIYADPGMNFYSNTWDVLISCLGLVFVVLVFLQQRYGGRWVVPKRFNNTIAYEMVPMGTGL